MTRSGVKAIAIFPQLTGALGIFVSIDFAF